jgi:F-type H+-transporting ATPase subunit delta
MKITPKQYATALLESLDGKKTSEKIQNFLLVVKRNKDQRQLNKILAEFEILWSRQEGKVSGKVSSFSKLSDSSKKHLVEMIKSMYRARAASAKGYGEPKDVELEVKEDVSLMGGFVVRFEDVLVDGSVKRSLMKLENELIN